MIRIRKVVPLALCALAVPLSACGGGPRLTVDAVEPAAMPRFVESARSAGFVDRQGRRVANGPCMYNANEIFKRFPDLVPPKVNIIANQECEPEELTGGAAAVDVNGDGIDDVVMTRMYDTPVLYLNVNPSFAMRRRGRVLNPLIRTPMVSGTPMSTGTVTLI